MDIGTYLVFVTWRTSESGDVWSVHHVLKILARGGIVQGGMPNRWRSLHSLGHQPPVLAMCLTNFVVLELNHTIDRRRPEEREAKAKCRKGRGRRGGRGERMKLCVCRNYSRHTVLVLS